MGVVSAKNSRGRYLRSGTLYGGTLSLEQKVPERQKLMKLLLGVTIMSPEIRMALAGWHPAKNIRCCCAGRGQAVGPKRQR